MMIRFQDLIFAMMVFVSKIYEEKTIEVGVYIDRHLYKNMEEVVKYFFPAVFHREDEGGIVFKSTHPRERFRGA